MCRAPPPTSTATSTATTATPTASIGLTWWGRRRWGNLDEYYTYDNLNRLTLMQRGTLTGTPPSGISGTPVAQQDWALDDTGNWDQFLVMASGITTLNQSRTQNPVNEITAISETVGSSWIDPTYDAAGNMISGPKAGAEKTRLHFIFDAWNRMVTLKADSSGSPGSTIASYAYDGLKTYPRARAIHVGRESHAAFSAAVRLDCHNRPREKTPRRLKRERYTNRARPFS